MSKLEKFKEQMQIELNANAHKGNWEDFTDVFDIHYELQHHINKLKEAEELTIEPLSKSCIKERMLIKEYIADCANILMMLGNAYGLYEE